MSAWDDPEGDEQLEEEERMDRVTRHAPAPRTFGPGRELYQLAGPANPTYDELSPRLQRAYAAAARYLRWEHEQDGTPGALQTPAGLSPVEAFEGRAAAVLSVLKRSPVIMGADGGDPTDEQWRSLAEECLAAAEVGF